MIKKGLSIIICCYNSESRLPKVLVHLAKQEIGNDIPVELIIVNNVSTDHTTDVAQKEWGKYNNHFSFRMVDEEKPGQMFARQRGVEEAQYEYIIFCDDDNWLQSDYLQKAFDIMETNPHIGALGGQSIAVSNIDLPEWFADFEAGYAVGKQSQSSGDVSARGYLWGAGLMTRKILLSKIFNKKHPMLIEGRTGGKLISGDDSEICKRILLLGYSLHYDSDLLFYHYMTPNRLTWAYKKNLFEGFDDSWHILHKYDFVYRELNKTGWRKMKGILLHTLNVLLKRGNLKNELAVKIALLCQSSKISKDSAYSRILRFLFDNR